MVRSTANEIEEWPVTGKVIGFAGLSGSGKTTLATSLVRELEKVLGVRLVVYLSNENNQRFGTWERIGSLGRHPLLLLKLVSKRAFWAGGSDIRAKFSGLSVMARARDFRSQGEFVILDQAHLAVPSLYDSSFILGDPWWPDLLIEVCAPNSERESRLQSRRKLGSRSDRLLLHTYILDEQLSQSELARVIDGDRVPTFSEWISSNCEKSCTFGHLRLLTTQRALPDLNSVDLSQLSKIIASKLIEDPV